MNSSIASSTIDGIQTEAGNTGHRASSAVSWSAIFAGAATAAALSLILLILGVGLGLSSASPWANEGIGAKTFGVSTILWITFTQLVAAGMGGYLAGRLRTRWLQVHVDEVYFRDTAHGFLAWAVASLATAALLGSVIGSIVHGGVQAGAAVAGGVANSAMAVAAGAAQMPATDREDGSMGYFVDSLFRNDGRMPASPEAAPGMASGDGGAQSAEVTRIFMNTLRNGALAPQDLSYVGQLVAARTGLSQPEAEARVSAAYASAQAKLRAAEVAAREAADHARKASAGAALWLFISLLVGAFVASLAATLGGRQRDH